MTDRQHIDDQAHPALARRTLLRATALTGAVGASASLLAACGADSPQQSGSESSGSGSGGSGGSGGGSGGSGGSGGDQVLAQASTIPVGGGMIFNEQKIVVTQPAQGEFQGLSAVCTHQGCTVGEVAGGTINCPCHGSKFNLDGTVANGPATQPLPEKPITVQGGQIRLS